MKKLLLVIVLAFGFAFVGLVPSRVAAAGTNVLTSGGGGSPCANPNATSTPDICKDNATGSSSNPIVGPNGVLSKITSIVLYVVGILAVIMVIISGIRMAVANGDSNAFNSARTGLIYSVIGLAVAVLARAIVLYIISRL